MRSYLPFFFLWLLVGVSCIDRPDYVIDEPLLTDILVDVHRAEGFMEIQSRNMTFESEQQLMAAVLMSHGVSRAQYDSSLVWYAQHLNLLIRVYGHVNERLDEEYAYWQSRISEKRDFLPSDAGPDVNVWSPGPYVLLSSVRCTDRLRWTLVPDSNYVAGDTLRWQLHVHQPVNRQVVVASICSMTQGEGVTQVASTDSTLSLTFVTDKIRLPEQVFFSLTTFCDTSVASQPILVDGISLRRIHVVEEE